MTELKLTVIGENSGCPQPGGATSCYLLTYGNEHLVLDLGSGALSRLMSAVDFDSVNDIILTHGHADLTDMQTILRMPVSPSIHASSQISSDAVFLPCISICLSLSLSWTAITR